MKLSLEAHKEALRQMASKKNDEIEPFLENFKNQSVTGLNAGSMRYILNLNEMRYDFVSDACFIFTGLKASDFYKKGLDILPEIIKKQDFKALSNDLFPEMNNLAKKMNIKDQEAIVFELYYRMQNINTGKLISVVEYSSYAGFDQEGKPSFSTGICYESTLCFNGVRGLLRLNRKDEQETLFDKTIHYSTYVLTPSEKKILGYLLEGKAHNEIASEEFISPHTVKTHIKNIYKKLDVNKVTELMARFNNQ